MIETVPNRMMETGTTTSSIWGPTYRRLTIGLVLTITGAAFEALAVATTLPLTVADLGGLKLYGWAFSAFMLTNLIGIIVTGGEADRQGPAKPFGLGVLLFALGLIIAGAAPSMPIMIIGRAVQGLGAGVIGSVAYVVVGRGYPPSLKPQMLAVMSTAWVVPGLIGPAIAGFIADQLGWRSVFLGLVPLPLVAAVLALPALRRLPATPGAPVAWQRVRAAVQLAVGGALLIAGLSSSGLMLAAMVAAGGLIAVPTLRLLLPTGTLRAAPGTAAAVATHGLLCMAFFGVDAFVPLTLTAIRGQSTTAAGLVLTAATVTWTMGAWLQARYASEHSRRRLVMIGLGLVACGIAGTTGVLNHSVPVVLAPAAWGIAGLGIGLAYSTLTLVVLEAAPAGAEGVESAALQVANVLGVALGAGLGGAIIGAADNVAGRSIALHDGLMLAVVGLALYTAQRLPGRPPV